MFIINALAFINRCYCHHLSKGRDDLFCGALSLAVAVPLSLDACAVSDDESVCKSNLLLLLFDSPSFDVTGNTLLSSHLCIP